MMTVVAANKSTAHVTVCGVLRYISKEKNIRASRYLFEIVEAIVR